MALPLSEPAPVPLLIRGERVTIRDWREGDVDERLRSLLDPSRPWHDTNGPYFGRPTPEETDRQWEALRDLAAADPDEFPKPREHPLPIIERETGRVVGSVSWYWEDKRTDWRRLGVVIYDEDVWGRGYASEALGRFASYLFDSTDALRLDLATYSGNAGMIAVAKRLGFVEEARMRQARRWEGGVHDAVVLGVLREEWEAACARHGFVWRQDAEAVEGDEDSDGPLAPEAKCIDAD